MNHKTTRRLAGIALIALLGISLLGCKTETTMTKTEESNFKGGPMPAGFLEKNGGAPGATAPAAATAPRTTK